MTEARTGTTPETKSSPLAGPCPRKFTPHAFGTALTVARSRPAVWAWLNNPDTFVKGQVWPFRVEFVDGSGEPDGDGRPASGIAPGVLNVHHGPLLHLPGRIGAVDAGEDGLGHHRELLYLYGGYAIAWTLVRPTRLAFWLADDDENDEACVLTVRVESYCKPWIAGFWNAAQSLFWRRFFKWTARAIRA